MQDAGLGCSNTSCEHKHVEDIVRIYKITLDIKRNEAIEARNIRMTQLDSFHECEFDTIYMTLKFNCQVVELFIRFPMHPRSLKSKFGTKS